MADVGRLLDQFAVLVDPVARQVSPQVSIRRGLLWNWRTNVGHVDDRAGLWVADAEQQEVVRQIAREDDEVRLRVARRESGGLRRPLAGADRCPDGCWVG